MLTKIRVVWTHPLEVAQSILLVAIVVVIFCQVVFRYLLHHSLSWSEELARYLLIWLAMLSAAYGFKTSSHFALTLIVVRFGAGMQRALGILTTVAMSAFLLVFIVSGAIMTQSGVGRVGPGTHLPLAVPYASTVVGGILMLYYLLRAAFAQLRQGNQQTSDSIEGPTS